MIEIAWVKSVNREGPEKQFLGYVNIYRLNTGRRDSKGGWEGAGSEVTVMWLCPGRGISRREWLTMQDAARRWLTLQEMFQRWRRKVFSGNICQHLLLAQPSSRSWVPADSGHGFSVLQVLETQLMYSEFNSSSFHKACLPLLGSLVMKTRSPHPPAAPSSWSQFCLLYYFSPSSTLSSNSLASYKEGGLEPFGDGNDLRILTEHFLIRKISMIWTLDSNPSSLQPCPTPPLPRKL